ncbi:MAG: hypothetical protein IT562_04750 [Alphaproteobacteria bacterium]|nr:hypothetical protein [Alphaproteobacteria bacterium]
MIYATDIQQPMAQIEPCKPSLGRRCGNTVMRGFTYLAVTAAIFVAVGGAALAALGS